MTRALLLLVLAGCGPNWAPAWTSPVYGIQQMPGELSDYFTPSVFDASAARVQETLGADFLIAHEVFRNVLVETHAEAFPCADGAGLCNGDVVGALVRVRAMPCSALTHELAHFLIQYTDDPWGDPGHVLPVWSELGGCE